MLAENQEHLNELNLDEAKFQSQNIAEATTKSEGGSKAGMPEEADVTVQNSETKNNIPDDFSASDIKSPVYQNPSLGRQISTSPHPSLAEDIRVQSAAPEDASTPTTSPSADRDLLSAASAGRAASPGRKSAARVSPGAASAAAVPPGLTSRISSLSATARASLRVMIAHSSVVRADSGSATSEHGGGGGGGAGDVPTDEEPASISSTEPAAPTGVGRTEGGGSATGAVTEQQAVKREPPDSAEAVQARAVANDVPEASLRTQESEAFTPMTAPFSPETERQDECRTPASAATARGSSAASGRGMKIVKEMPSPRGRRSSAHLYNDWDRTLYEKTGRPPPGEAHWSREKLSHHGRSPTRPSGTGSRSQSRRSDQPATRSPSARRQRSGSRPATSPSRRRPFDMARCERETQDQFGRRILYRHCFLEPEFALCGQRIPVHGARRGSIIAAEDTYAGYALELVTPPPESLLATQKMRRRSRVRKKRRRRRRRRRSTGGKSSRREQLLIEDQWRRLEEESERLEEDRLLLQDTRQHLERLEEWWHTEGLLVMQRDELRAEEEKILNAVIEEECLRINDESARIRQEWQLLLECMARQEKDEVRIKEENSALDEKQEEIAHQEETGLRRIREMKAVFEIERRMMEVDRKRLVSDALTGDAFRDAIEDAELRGWGLPLGEAYSGTLACSAAGGQPTQLDIDDPGLKENRVELADELQLPAVSAEPTLRDSPVLAETGPVQRPPTSASFQTELRSATPDSDGGHPASVARELHGQRPLRPITARGRPVGASRSTPAQEAEAQRTARTLSAVRSEGSALTATATGTSSGGGGGETVDVWRRRPTVLQRSDISSVVFVTEENNPSGNREGSSTRAPSVAFTMPDEPTRRRAGDRGLLQKRSRELPHQGSDSTPTATSGEYLDPDAKTEPAGLEQRRASASPHPEARERSLSSLPACDGASTPTVCSDTAPVHSETTVGTQAALPEMSQRTASVE